MISEKEALQKVKKLGHNPVSCRFMKDYYVFCLERTGFSFLAVLKEDGTVFPYTPGIDLVGFSNAEVKEY